MNTPREPKRLVLLGGQRPEVAEPVEPFVRLAALASRDGSKASALTQEEKTGSLIRRAGPVEGLDPEQLDRVWHRLASRNVARGRGRVGVRLPLRWAFVVVVVVLSGGAVGAGAGVWNWPRDVVRRWTAGPSTVAPTTQVALRTAPRGRGRGPLRPSVAFVDQPSTAPEAGDVDVPPLSPVSTTTPSTPPATATVTTAGPQHPRRDRVPVGLAAPQRAPVGVTTVSPLAEESALIGSALARLRQERDPVNALAELDRYAARFPSGLLAPEADSARVDALLMAGRWQDARTALGKLTLAGGGRNRELRLIRAELTAQTSCADALGDYQAVLSNLNSGPLAERALWGSAACRSRLGDEKGALADLASYLTRFPSGVHAADARARLRKE